MGKYKRFFLIKGETEDFHQKNVLVLSFACIEICQKTLLPGHLDFHEKFSRRFEAKNRHILDF